MSAVEEIDGEAPASHSVVAAPAVEAKTVTPRKVVFVPAASARRPLLYSLRPPIYSAPSYSLSMFSPVRNPEVRPARPRSVAVTARTANVAHPLVAVVLTIVLAFLVSVGIFVYVSTSWAGQLLFRWEEEIWSGFYSRSLPPSLKPPGSFSPDTSSLPHR
jgi:hypothetical protein